MLDVTPTTLAIFFSGVALGLVVAAAITSKRLAQLRDAVYLLGRPHSWQSGDKRWP